MLKVIWLSSQRIARENQRQEKLVRTFPVMTDQAWETVPHPGHSLRPGKAQFPAQSAATGPAHLSTQVALMKSSITKPSLNSGINKV